MGRKTPGGSAPSRLIALAAALVLAFIALVAALDRFELAEGARIQPTIADTLDRAFQSQDRSGRNPYSGSVYSWVVTIVVGLSVITFIVGLLHREHRYPTLMLVVLGGVAAILFATIEPNPVWLEDESAPGEMQGESGESGELGGFGEVMPEEDAVDVTVERETGPSPWSWLVAIPAIAGILIIVRPKIRFRIRGKSERQELEERARSAIEAASSGQEVSDVIIRCYRDMVKILERSQDVTRTRAMTPREFVTRLTGLGAPMIHVRELTTLFERTRYGDLALSAREKEEAVRHLEQIAGALGDTGA